MVVDYDGKGGGEVLFSVETLVTYEQEFGRDMIQDIIGRVALRDDEEGTTLLDFRDTNWTAVTRALWAGLKTADPRVPSFSAWSKGVSGIDLYSLSNQVVTAVAESFFRAPATAAGQEA